MQFPPTVFCVLAVSVIATSTRKNEFFGSCQLVSAVFLAPVIRKKKSVVIEGHAAFVTCFIQSPYKPIASEKLSQLTSSRYISISNIILK